MKIRHATEADTPRLIEMTARFLLNSHYGALFSNTQTPALIAVLVANVLSMGVIIVAEFEAAPPYEVDPCLQCYDQMSVHCGDCSCCPRLVGMLALVALPHFLTGDKMAEELAWWVEPEHRGGTLGPKMLRAGEEWATTNGAIMVKMVAPAGSTVGDFYKLVGYEPIETAYIKRI